MRRKDKVKTAFVEAYAPELRRSMRGEEPDLDRFEKEFRRQLEGRLR